jgi:hypothetical protein
MPAQKRGYEFERSAQTVIEVLRQRLACGDRLQLDPDGQFECDPRLAAGLLHCSTAWRFFTSDSMEREI